MNKTKKQTKNRESTGLASQCTSFLQFITKQPENYEFSLEELSLKFGFILFQNLQTIELEKRRLYDIINVLEVFDFFEKASPGNFKYKGRQNMTKELSKLKTKGLSDKIISQRILTTFKNDENVEPATEDTSPLEPKGLVNITKLFLQIFLVSERSEIKQFEIFSIFFPGQPFDSRNSKSTFDSQSKT
jgi:hypothetical protein